MSLEDVLAQSFDNTRHKAPERRQVQGAGVTAHGWIHRCKPGSGITLLGRGQELCRVCGVTQAEVLHALTTAI